MHRKQFNVIFLVLAICIFASCSKSTYAADKARLAAAGKALQPVVVSSTATPQVKALAATLAQYLEKMSGAPFEVKTGDGKMGLAVGTAADFPVSNLANEFDADDPTRREEYLLRSHGDGVYLIGATELAVSHAVWDFLYRLGYRDFFASPHWEVIPPSPDLTISVNTKEHPDFYDRRIWYEFGTWPGNGQAKADWDARNRMASGLKINNSHIYDGIIHQHQDVFKQHPEYLTKPGGNKFCVSNPGLRQLVVEWALSYFEKNPDADSISMEPSDGGGWESDSCPDATVYPSITDRVVTLANDVAEAVNKKFHNKYVGIYAYSSHSASPTIKVDPHVAVGVATQYSAGFDNIAPGWQKQGATIGVREYYSIVVFDKARPGAVGSSNFMGVADSIKKQYEMGARFMSAESSDSWGPAGLGYYVAARLLWNHNENPKAIVDDFFEKAFGPAQKPMRDFYGLIDRGNDPLFTSALVGQMYRDIDAARKLTNDTGIQSRLDDLALYTRYAELVHDIRDEKSAEAAMAFAYRIRDRHMVPSYALWRDTRHWPMKAVGDISWKTPEGQNPLKGSAPFAESEISEIINNGIADNPLVPFEEVHYSKDLVPATPLGLKIPGKPGGYYYDRFAHHFYLWVDKAPAVLPLTVTGGFVGSGGDLTMQLRAMSDPACKVLASVQVPKDKQPHTVAMKTTFAGLHRIDVDPGKNGAHVSWPEGTPVVFASSLEERIGLSSRIDMYFYVPKNTKVVGGYAQGVGNVLDGNGKKVFEFTGDKFNNGAYFSIPVAPGEDGKLWEFTFSAGPRYLMTVPPYLARSGQELLLPREVVEKDRVL
jgi:hypothetical protein